MFGAILILLEIFFEDLKKIKPLLDDLSARHFTSRSIVLIIKLILLHL